MVALQRLSQNEYLTLMQFKPFNEKVQGRQEITRETAIKILKGIETSKKIKSFLTKPKVVILTSVALSAAGFVLAVIAPPLVLPSVTLAVAIKVSGVVLAMGGIITMGLVIKLQRLSNDYHYQSSQAHRLIEMLKNPEIQ